MTSKFFCNVAKPASKCPRTALKKINTSSVVATRWGSACISCFTVVIRLCLGRCENEGKRAQVERSWKWRLFAASSNGFVNCNKKKSISHAIPFINQSNYRYIIKLITLIALPAEWVRNICLFSDDFGAGKGRTGAVLLNKQARCWVGGERLCVGQFRCFS